MTESFLTPEEKEIKPRARVLIVSAQPFKKQNVRISQELFGTDADSIEKFTQLAVTNIKSPKPSEQAKYTEREKESSLYLPDSVDDFAAIVVTGSPYAAYPREEEKGLFLASWKKELALFVRKAHEHNIPILGICFGSHILAEALGGKVVRMKSKAGVKVWEGGWGKIRKSPNGTNDPLLKDLSDEFVASQNHGDVVARLPEGAKLIAENEYGVQGFRIGNAWGLEFHPERKPEKVDEYFVDEDNLKEIKAQGLDPEKLKALGDEYDSNLRKIFSNFLKLAWKGIQ